MQFRFWKREVKLSRTNRKREITLTSYRKNASKSKALYRGYSVLSSDMIFVKSFRDDCIPKFGWKVIQIWERNCPLHKHIFWHLEIFPKIMCKLQILSFDMTIYDTNMNSSKSTFTKWNFTRVLMILHKSCLWEISRGFRAAYEIWTKRTTCFMQVEVL